MSKSKINKKYINELIRLYEEDGDYNSKFKSKIFQYNHKELVKLFNILKIEGSSFFAVTIGKWGDCKLPNLKNLIDAKQTQNFVINNFEQITKYGGVYFFIIPNKRPSIILNITYRDEIVVFFRKGIETNKTTL